MLGMLGFRYNSDERFRRIVVLGDWSLSNGMRVVATATTPELVLAWISTRSRSVFEMKGLIDRRLGELRGLLPPGVKPPHVRMSRRGVQVQGKFTQYIWEDLKRYDAQVDNINLTHSELEFVLISGFQNQM